MNSPISLFFSSLVSLVGDGGLGEGFRGGVGGVGEGFRGGVVGLGEGFRGGVGGVVGVLSLLGCVACV